MTAESSAEELASAMVEVWPGCEVLRTLDIENEEALWSVAEDARAEERSKGQAIVVWGFYAVDGRAVCVDPTAVLHSGSKELASLSTVLGDVIALMLGTHGGTAGFSCFRDGACVREVLHLDGETTYTGEPIDAEAEIDSGEFYWDECELLWSTLGLGELTGGYSGPLKVVVLRDHECERELAKLRATPSGPAKRRWWHFWRAE